MAWAKAYLHAKCYLDPSSRLEINGHGPRIGSCVSFLGRRVGPRLPQCGRDRGPPPCLVPSWSIQQFGHNRNGCGPFLGRGAGSSSNTMSLGPRPTSLLSGALIHPAIWRQQIWTENGGCVPLEGAGSPSNTTWPWPRPTCMPSFIFIHPTIWPKYTNVADRTDRQDSGPIA